MGSVVIDGITYVCSVEDGVWVCGCSSDVTVAQIRSNVSFNWYGTTYNYPVRGIERKSFGGCDRLTHVTIPNSVHHIDSGAFSGSGLTSVTIENGMTNLSWGFCNCSNLTSVTIPNSVKSIPADAFSGCNSLPGVAIPNGVTTIGDRAFSDCKSLSSVTIPNGVTNIGASAFAGCSSLSSVTIPDSTTSLGYTAFRGCIGLVKATILGNVTNDYITKNGLSLPLFDGCTNLETVVLGDNMTKIGQFMFYGCSNLKNITVPDKVANIGKYAFKACSNLTNVTIGNNVKSIGNGAFSECVGLVSATILGNVTNDYTTYYENDFTYSHYPPYYPVFDGCTNLEKVVLGDNMTKIGAYMFFGCTGLTSVTIPGSVKNLGRGAFMNCSRLADVWFKGIPPISSYLSFTQVASGARGHYTKEYAAEWKAAIGENGKWEGLIMEGPVDYIVCLHRNWTVTEGDESTVNVEFKFGEEKQLPEYPFRDWLGVDVAEQFMGWSVGTSSYAAETPRELWENGKALKFTKEEANRWATRWKDNVPVIDLYAIWKAKVTVKLFNTGEKVRELSPISLREHVRWRINTAEGERKSGDTVLVPPGYQRLILSVDSGFESYVWDWSVVNASGEILSGNGDGAFQFELSSGDGPIDRILEVKLTADTEPGTVRFRCEGEMTDAQKTGLTGFPAFAWTKAIIRVTRMGDGSAWPLEVEPQVPVLLPAGNYKAEYDYADMYWGATPNIGFFSVTAGREVEIPCMFMPYGSDHFFEEMAKEIDVTGRTTKSPVEIPYSWLMVKGAEVLKVAEGDCEAAAMATAANGMAVWECYVSGMDPEDTEAQFRAELIQEGEEWKVKPVGGKKAGRRYRVEGKREMTDEKWEDMTDVEDFEAEGWRFFRVGVELAE